MESPLISVIVPVFNGERFIKEALDSILAQTYSPLDVIVVDDGSTDGTLKIINTYADNIRTLRFQNQGPAAARNHGLDAAKSKFIAFLDADDIWHQDKLERQMNCFREREKLDICLTRVQNFWSLELENEKEHFQGHRISKGLPGYSMVSLLARRHIFEKIGQFNTHFKHVHDTEWFLRSAHSGAVIEQLPDVLVYRRLHQFNRSRQFAQASREEYLELIKANLDFKRKTSQSS